LTSEDVTFAGHLPYGQAVQLLTDSDVGLLPLYRNDDMDPTIPNKVFDYKSVGLPVITSDTIPSARIVHAEHSGIVFPARSVAGLASAIVRMTDPFTRLRMGENGKAAVARRYHSAHDGAALLATVERSQVDQRAAA
jgi:glycosyltransferase involved in cell wall biosynthesis